MLLHDLLAPFEGRVTAALVYRTPRGSALQSVYTEDVGWARENGIAAAADAHAPFSTWLAQRLDGGSLLHQPPWSSSLNPGRLASAYASTGFTIGVISPTGARRQARDVSDVVACDLLGVPCDCGKASLWSSYSAARTYETRYDGVAHGMQITIPRLMRAAGCDRPPDPKRAYGDDTLGGRPTAAEVDAFVHEHRGAVRCTDLSTLDELLAAFDAPFVVRYADAMLPRWDALAESKERSSRQYCELDLSVDRTWAALRRSGEARGYNCSDGADFARWAAAAKAAGVRAKEATRQRRAKAAAVAAATSDALARPTTGAVHEEVERKSPRLGSGGGTAAAAAGSDGEVELKLAVGASLAGPRGILEALKSGCDPRTPCSLQLQSLARAGEVSAARSKRLAASGGPEATAWAECGPTQAAGSSASPPPPRVAYVLATSPFARDGGRGQGAVHGEDVLRMHLLALSATAAAISRLLLMVPSESSSSDEWEARINGDYLDVHAEAVRLPFPATLIRIPNNTLGSYGMYLTAYAMRRDQYDYYVLAEDDYLPVRPRFDEALVRMYAQTFGRRPGVLAGLLQGRPVEPTSPWRLHCESSHIMSASSLRRLFRQEAHSSGRLLVAAAAPPPGCVSTEDCEAEGGTAEGGGGRGHIIEHALALLSAEGICTTATRATSPRCEQTVDAYFDRVQLAFGALLRAASVEARDWAAAYRSPYWDHTAIVDWSGAAHDFRVPSERVLIAPVQWVFAARVRVCCAPFDCIYLRAPNGGEASSCFLPRRSPRAETHGSAPGRHRRTECCVAFDHSSVPRLRLNTSVPASVLDVRDARAEAEAGSTTSRCTPLQAAALLVDGRTMAPS